MSKPKFQYVSYDYTFLYNKSSNWDFLPKAVKVAAQTIGFDLVDSQPMAEPVGQIYWMDYTYDDSVSTAATYKPRQTGATNLTTWYDIYQFEKIKRERKANYFKKLNFYKNLNAKRYGKKV